MWPKPEQVVVVVVFAGVLAKLSVRVQLEFCFEEFIGAAVGVAAAFDGVLTG